MESPSTLERQLRYAIAHRRLIQFTYHSTGRVAEPHDYGLKNGSLKVLVYQIRGASRTAVYGWKLLDVAKIEGLAVLEQTFRGTRVAPGQHHMEWDELFARVQ